MNKTSHTFFASLARDLESALSDPAAFIVTSPPYPLISMWDATFAAQSQKAADALRSEQGERAFAAMHEVLDEVWAACWDSLLDGGVLCVNIGDTVRTIGGVFRLYSNYARIVASLERLGFTLLPSIVWRKPANSPTKFMGSGMLPGGAYVTLEHEHVVIARKGAPRRPHNESDRLRRRRSAIFWEERNEWYSDLWLLRGVRQPLAAGRTPRSRPSTGAANRDGESRPQEFVHARERSAAYPLELAYRLIAMHSWAEDLVLDPFAGTGTTAAAAMALGRSSLSVDCDSQVLRHAYEWIESPSFVPELRARAESRLANHTAFVEKREKPFRHHNHHYDVPVVTSQETDLVVPVITEVARRAPGDASSGAVFTCGYE